MIGIAPSQVIRGKRCLAYCGDEFCDCDAGPLGHDRIARRVPSAMLDDFAEEREQRRIRPNPYDVSEDPDFLTHGAVRLEVRVSPRLEKYTYWSDRGVFDALDPVKEFFSSRRERVFGRPRYAIRARSRWSPMHNAPRRGHHVFVCYAASTPAGQAPRYLEEEVFFGDDQRYPAAWIEVRTLSEFVEEPLGWRTR